MPTIQQLVRKGRVKIEDERFWLIRVNHRHWIHVLRDVAFAYVFTLQLRKNRTQQCVKLLVCV